jgi:hypothetical protein
MALGQCHIRMPAGGLSVPALAAAAAHVWHFMEVLLSECVTVYTHYPTETYPDLLACATLVFASLNTVNDTDLYCLLAWPLYLRRHVRLP